MSTLFCFFALSSTFFPFFSHLNSFLLSFFFFFLMIRRPPRSPLFPSPPLSRSDRVRAVVVARRARRVRRPSGAPAARDGLAAALDGRRRDHRAGHVLRARAVPPEPVRSEEHTSELQSRLHLVCRLLLEKKYAGSMQQLVQLGGHCRAGTRESAPIASDYSRAVQPAGFGDDGYLRLYLPPRVRRVTSA